MNTLGSVVLLFVIYYAAPAHTIKCYTCSGPGCQDPFTPVGTASFELECTPDFARKGLNDIKNTFNNIATNLGFGTPNVDTGDLRLVCAKVDSKDANSNPKVTRSCALHSDKSTYCENAKTIVGEGFVGCSICEGDLCNGSSVTHISLGLMTATVVILMSFLR